MLLYSRAVLNCSPALLSRPAILFSADDDSHTLLLLPTDHQSETRTLHIAELFASSLHSTRHDHTDSLHGITATS